MQEAKGPYTGLSWMICSALLLAAMMVFGDGARPPKNLFLDDRKRLSSTASQYLSKTEEGQGGRELYRKDMVAVVGGVWCREAEFRRRRQMAIRLYAESRFGKQ